MAAAATIHTPHIRYLAIMPEIVMLGGAVLLLAVASLVRRPLRVAVATAGTVVISLTALGFALWQWADVHAHGPFTAVDSAVAVDGFSVLVSILVPCAMALDAPWWATATCAGRAWRAPSSTSWPWSRPRGPC